MNTAFESLTQTEQKELLGGVLNNSYHGIVALEAIRDERGEIGDFRYTFCNRKAEDGLGAPAAEVVGNTLLGLFPGVKEEGIFPRFVQVVETGTPYSFDQPYHRDGISGYYHSSASKFRDGLLISFLETTKLVSESENWKRLTKRYEMATKAAGVGVWELDLKTNVLFWDNGMFDIYNTKREDFRGVLEDWSDKVHPDDLLPAQQVMEKSISENAAVAMKFRIIPCQGVIRWIDARANVERDEEGQPVRLIGTNWDITELQNAYDCLAEAKSLAEEANAAKSEFLAVMSHELRTPLNPIIGGTDLLYESISNENDQAILDMIQNCGKSLLNLISDILDFCTIDAGRLKLEPISVDLNRVTEEVVSEFSLAVKQKGIALNLITEKFTPGECIIDPKRYKQIIRNLISNAVKFTIEGSIEVELFKPSTEKNCGIMTIQVRDTGEGIPEDKQDFVFEHFTQIDSSNKRREGGTGLGLAICRKLCQLMGGEISVDAELGRGSTFTVTLPCAAVCSLENDASLHEQNDSSDSYGSAIRVLLVDDDGTNLFYLSEVLRREGVNDVTVEQDSQKGRILASEGNFDLVFLDVHMPEVTGCDIARDVRKNTNKSGHPYLVAITADLREENTTVCEKSGFDRIIHKPARPQDIRMVLKDFVR